MTQPTPVRDGFRAIWRQPSIFFAELSWRWSWGGAALALTALALYEYLNTLVVTRGDLILLRLRHPLAVSRALVDIFRGSGPRVVQTAIVLVPALAVLWIALGALGRYATLRALFSRTDPEWQPKSGSVRALTGLHALRVALALAALVSFFGAGVVASLVRTPEAPRPGLALLIFVPIVVLVSVIWSYVNWFLSVAVVFVVSEGEDTFRAIVGAVDFCRRRAGRITAIGFWFGAMHLVAFVIGTTVVMYPLAIASLVPPIVTLTLMAAIALTYCAVADWLYVARLASYAALLGWDRSPASIPDPDPIPVAPAVRIDIPPPPPPGPPTLVPAVAGSAAASDDEPLFSSHPPSPGDDFDEPLMPGFSPGEPLPGR